MTIASWSFQTIPLSWLHAISITPYNGASKPSPSPDYAISITPYNGASKPSPSPDYAISITSYQKVMFSICSTNLGLNK